MDEERVDEVLDNMTVLRDDICRIQSQIASYQNIIDKAAHGVMCKLTEFVDVLNSPYPQDEDLLEEIVVYNRIADFKEDAANKYNYPIMTEREEDMILCGFCDKDAIGSFREVVRFPFSYLYRMDWLYRLEVELGVFRLKDTEKNPWRYKK